MIALWSAILAALLLAILALAALFFLAAER